MTSCKRLRTVFSILIYPRGMIGIQLCDCLCVVALGSTCLLSPIAMLPISMWCIPALLSGPRCWRVDGKEGQPMMHVVVFIECHISPHGGWLIPPHGPTRPWGPPAAATVLPAGHHSGPTHPHGFGLVDHEANPGRIALSPVWQASKWFGLQHSQFGQADWMPHFCLSRWS